MKRRLNLNPLAHLMPLPQPERTRIALALLSAVDEIAGGRHPGRAEWDGITDVINVVDTLAERGDVVLDAGLVQRAEDAMVAAAGRYQAGKAMRFDGPGLEAVREVCGVYLWIVEHWTEARVRQAQDRTHRRLNAAVRSGTVRVVEVRA